MRLCRCGAPLPVADHSRVASFCSIRCRVGAHRARHKAIPAELRALPRWTRHQAKRPITVKGRPASSIVPTTWSTYGAAAASRVGDGLGFVLNGDGIVGIDLDHCVTKGVLSPGALAILELLPDTYAEISPSGHGVRLFCRADITRGGRITVDGCALEVYGTGRFMTVTGNRLPDRPSVLADLDGAVRALLPERRSTPRSSSVSDQGVAS